MKGRLIDGSVFVDISQKLLRRKIGRKEGNRLVLLPEEAAYLIHQGTLEVYGDGGIVNFDEILSLCDPIRYFAYEDLRDRGVRVDFREFDGYVPAGEDEVFSVADLMGFAGKKLAVVDSEAEVTYFLVERFDEEGRHEEDLREFRAKFVNGFFVTDYLDLFRKYFYGVLKGNRVVLSAFEAVYLMERGFLISGADMDYVRNYCMRSIPDFEKRYSVYRDLRERRFMVKTGFKFGSDYRVYEYVRSVSELKHSKYLVRLRDRVAMFELAGDVRLSSAVNKTVLYPIFEDGSLEYLAVRRVKV